MMIRAAILVLSLAVFTAPAEAQIAAECAVRRSPCHVGARLPMAGIESSQDARDFLARLKSAAQADNHNSLAGMVRYPLTIYAGGEPVSSYQDAEALLENFGAVFTPAVMSAIDDAQYKTLFVNDQGVMIGDGEIWFDGWAGAILIKSVNP